MHTYSAWFFLLREYLVFSLGRRSTVLGSYTPEDELGVLTMIESVQPATVYLRCALQQRLLTLLLETVMRSSQVSK